MREIGDHFDISSPNGVMCHLRALEKKGLITREPNMSRAIQLTAEPVEETGLPLVGEVAAGVMHEAIEQSERIDFGNVFGRKNQFVLKVRGDSMIDAQIADGDYVVIRRARTANRGQMVVAQTEEGEATLKYWFRKRTEFDCSLLTSQCLRFTSRMPVSWGGGRRRPPRVIRHVGRKRPSNPKRKF